ncbi:MAG: sigma 54-interacting transcriptional regulator, partial [Desulfatitalea sp.]|nr:sigma 54-interacting transcriptional regulator [Desulfatitalea sp.]
MIQKVQGAKVDTCAGAQSTSSDPGNTLNQAVEERIKELDCIFAICEATANSSASFDETIQNITDKIPMGFKNPENTCACVTVLNKVFSTANFQSCPWQLETELVVSGKMAGRLEIGHRKARPDETDPFLDEERKLLRAIVARIELEVANHFLKNSFRESDHRYRNLVENALVGIFQTNIRGDLLYANSTYLRILGYQNLQEAMSAGAFNGYRDLDERRSIIEALKESGKINAFEVKCITVKGDPIVALLNATLEADVITGMLMDITERKRTDAALITSEMRLSEAQRIAQIGSWDWDVGTGELRWSEEVYRIFGIAPGATRVTYESFLALVHPDDRQSVQDALDRSLADPVNTYSIDHRVVRADGAECVVHERGEVIFDKHRRPVRVMGTVQDITARKQAEVHLRAALDAIKTLKDKLEAENIYLRDEMELKDGCGDIVGTSDPIKYAMHRIRQVSRMNTTVTLTGETGTGKGVFARFLHRESNRRDKPFVNVTCVSLPANLIESELFGREKGAFTGSSARQIGRFELAHGGTIFLDEIGELPIELQPKLLRVIEDGEFERLGNPRTIKVDVRVIASTNRNLEEEIACGRFRKDLFYRLNVFPVTLP